MSKCQSVAMELLVALLVVLLCATQTIFGCCPNFTESPQWQQMEKKYQTADFINADCATVSVKLAFAESCEDFFAVKWFCAKMCARHCGGADVSKITCPSRHEMFCRNGGYGPENIDFQCNCVRRNLQPLCKTKWFTLEELSDNFNSSCLSATTPLPKLTTPLAAATTPPGAISTAPPALSSPPPAASSLPPKSTPASSAKTSPAAAASTPAKATSPKPKAG